MTDYSRVLASMDSQAKQDIAGFLREIDDVWVPQEGPQEAAYYCEADILFYGGAAGGGKTDLLLGTALTAHQYSLIMRREGTQFRGITRRMAEILGSTEGKSGSGGSMQWTYLDKLLEFGSCPDLGDEEKHQGIPHDLLGFDEITHFLEFQFRFLMTWLRSVTPGQRCRVICTGNPPTTDDGSWVRSYWAPWLDPECPIKAAPGELLWYVTNPETGEDTMVEGPEKIEMEGEIVTPMSRTFIPSDVEHNEYLKRTSYKTTLQSLPEPLRSQMLKGDFSAGLEDNAWQVIPSSYVRRAQKRWETRQGRKPQMTSIGVDVARGGADQTVLARRHGNWYDTLLDFPGVTTPDGPSVASLFVQYQRDGAVACVDVIGVGTSVVDFMNENGQTVLAINGAVKCDLKDKTNKFGFVNLRSYLYWRFREALEDEKDQLYLPPDSELKTDLCCPRFKVTSSGKIAVESKDDIIKRIGRSPDRGDAVIYAYHHSANAQMLMGGKWVPFDAPLDYGD